MNIKATKFFRPILIATLFASVINIAHATQQDLAKSMIDQFKSDIDQELKSGEFKAPAQCLGVNETKLASHYKTVISHCFKTVNIANEGEVNQCMESQMQSKLYVSENTLTTCIAEGEVDDNYGGGPQSATEKEITVLEAEAERLDHISYDRDLTAQEQKKFASIEKELDSLYKISEQEIKAEYENYDAKKEFSDLAAMFELGAKNREHKITLPIYKNSKIKSHMEQGMSVGGNTSIPVAMLSSNDSTDKVAAFYKSELKNYKYSDLGDGGHIFMENMPENFNYLTHRDDILTTPHVTITVVGSGKEKQTMIEIAYKTQ